jgi:hypothetical protein
MHVRFAWPEKKVNSGARTMAIAVQLDGGAKQQVHIDHDSSTKGYDGAEDHTPGAYAGRGITVQLTEARAATATLHFEAKPALDLSEVMFWYADELTSAERKAMSKAGSKELMQVPTHNQFDLVQVGYMGAVFDAIKDAAEIIAMNLCLAGLSLVQGILTLVQVVFNGLASVLIWALEAAIKALGPHFFKINNLLIGGSFDGMKGGEIALEFGIDMWLAGIRIGPWGFRVVFNIAKIVMTLFNKLKDALGSVFRL